MGTRSCGADCGADIDVMFSKLEARPTESDESILVGASGGSVKHSRAICIDHLVN